MAGVRSRLSLSMMTHEAGMWADPEVPLTEVGAMLASRADHDLVMREVEMSAETRGDGPWVAVTKELWPWEKQV